MSRPPIDFSGERFGRLEAIEIVGKYRRESIWKCLCDCGRYAYVRLSNLRTGNTTSCGCWETESRFKK